MNFLFILSRGTSFKTMVKSVTFYRFSNTCKFFNRYYKNVSQHFHSILINLISLLIYLGAGGSSIINNMETTVTEHQFATFEIYP